MWRSQTNIAQVLRTPVAFIIFNRPESTARVFAAIAKAMPAKLLVIADGPRDNRPGEAERCAATRRILDSVDWPCEVLTNFAPHNLGCRRRVSSGIDWVFSVVPEAIFLEDDCLPDPTFFRFCEEMLDRYRSDERVMHIGGANFQRGAASSRSSYYFSRHFHVWGWASWRRAWRHYDVDMRAWPSVRVAGRLADVFPSVDERRTLEPLYDRVFSGTLDTWDIQWTLASRLQNGLAIVPGNNLISNIGFGGHATHTSDPGHPVANMETSPVTFPLTHPVVMLPDGRADDRTTATFRTSISRRARSLLFRLWYRYRNRNADHASPMHAPHQPELD